MCNDVRLGSEEYLKETHWLQDLDPAAPPRCEVGSVGMGSWCAESSTWTRRTGSRTLTQLAAAAPPRYILVWERKA